MNTIKNLFEIANKLEKKGALLSEDDLSTNLETVGKCAERIGKSWSRSWLGYHSRVYYSDFLEPPPGAHFSQEWGFMDRMISNDTRGDWKEYIFDDVIDMIYKQANVSDIQVHIKKAETIADFAGDAQSDLLSNLTIVIENRSNDAFLKDLLDKINKIKILTGNEILNLWKPNGSLMSRDIPAVEKGIIAPAHLKVLATVEAIKQPYIACSSLSKVAQRAASHLENQERRTKRHDRVGTNIFIGHGRASLWRELKDFINERLHLPWDEFNRVPVAGVTNITRLSQMLDECAFAFLVMTAEDEQSDGTYNARMNVIHEAGLFQGRLGFEKAIVLLEDGCSDFSNIDGLGQIRFPKGKINAIFEDIRQVLEREGIVDKD